MQNVISFVESLGTVSSTEQTYDWDVHIPTAESSVEARQLRGFPSVSTVRIASLRLCCSKKQMGNEATAQSHTASSGLPVSASCTISFDGKRVLITNNC